MTIGNMRKGIDKRRSWCTDKYSTDVCKKQLTGPYDNSKRQQERNDGFTHLMREDVTDSRRLSSGGWQYDEGTE